MCNESLISGCYSGINNSEVARSMDTSPEVKAFYEHLTGKRSHAR